MTTVRALAAPPTDPTGLWQLYDDKTGRPNGVVRLYVEDGTLRGRIERLRPGTILDPDSGDTYRCTSKIVDGNTLDVRGYVGISLFGRTQQWKRTN
ncbi:DUF2147 domain-containing protein [Sorangium sp. So ce854]|uniref:DUF2147 domain-containing protein n=1 Tax=Sorangium sp. So ce854 TaxID=3133322 RepID=UPI003F627695